MVRKYKRKRDKEYSKDDLQKAVEAVKTKKINSYKASEVFGVPRSTIVAHITGTRGQKQPTPGKPTVLSRQQEERLSYLLHVMEKAGHPLTRKELKTLIGEYIRRNGIVTPFKNDIPGDDWCQGFMKRNNLSTKKPQSVEVARKNACNPFTIYHYYDLLESVVRDLNLTDKPERIFNVDETSFCNDPSSSKIIGQKGYPSTRTTSGPGRDNTTVLLGANARGDKIPPLIVFKGKSLWNEWFYKNEHVQTAYSVSTNGWMETTIFEKYIRDVFIPAIGSERPVLLVYDGHKTHVDLGVVELAVDNNITILKLPPHSSHVLQPLDVSTMKSMKVHWEDTLVKWQRLHSGTKMPKSEFSRLLTEVWDNLNPAIIQNGFRKSGIYPVDRYVIPKDKFDMVALSKWEKILKDGLKLDENNKEDPNSEERQCTGELEENNNEDLNSEKRQCIGELEENNKEDLNSEKRQCTGELEENNKEDLNSEKRQCTGMDRKQVSQTPAILNDNPNSYAEDVPSLLTLVLNHINDQQNMNNLKQIQFRKAEKCKRTGKCDNVTTSKNKIVKPPDTITLDTPHNNSAYKDMNAGTSSISILNNKILNKGDPEFVNISFEELLLKTISRNNPSTNPRKKVPGGAEILTYKDFINSMKEEKEKKELEAKGKKLEKERKKEEKKLEKERKKEMKEILKRIKIENKGETNKKSNKNRKANNRKSKNIRIQKNKKIIYESNSDTEDDSLYSLKDSSDEEDSTDFFQTLLKEKNEEEDNMFINGKNLNLSQGSSKLVETITTTEKNRVYQIEDMSKSNNERNTIKKYKRKYTQKQKDLNGKPSIVSSKRTKTAEKVEDSNNLYKDNNFPSTSKEESKPVLCQSPKEGQFVLVKFSTAKAKKDYKYVCVIEGINDERIVVKGLKSFKKNKKVFRVVENDISIIDLTQIVAYLPTPVCDDSEKVFVFPFDVAIAEL